METGDEDSSETGSEMTDEKKKLRTNIDAYLTTDFKDKTHNCYMCERE